MGGPDAGRSREKQQRRTGAGRPPRSSVAIDRIGDEDGVCATRAEAGERAEENQDRGRHSNLPFDRTDFSAVEKALAAEYTRQCALLDSGGKVEQQTLLWDGARDTVRPSRTKEGSHDYRYFEEPDLRPLLLDAKWIEHLGSELPELPDERKKRLAEEYGLSSVEVEQLTAHSDLAEYFEAVARASADGKASYNWVMGEVQAALHASGEEISRFRVRPADLAQMLNLVRDGTVSHTAAKRVFAKMVETGNPAAQVAADEGLLQIGDEGAIATWIEEVLQEHPEEATRYLGGEKKLQGVLVGFVMKKSKGRADPKRVNQLLSTRGG